MPRIWLPILLILAVGAGVVFWPTEQPEGPLTASAAAAEDEEERDFAEVGELPQDPLPSPLGAPLDLSGGGAAQREGGDVLATRDPDEVDAEATVTVRVINQDGAPIEGATVGVLQVPDMEGEAGLRSLQPVLFAVQGAPVENKDFAITEVLSDLEGRASLPAPSEVQFVVYARLPRHLISFKLGEGLSDGEQHDLGDLRVAPGGYLEVDVVDDYGAPIEDAAVVMVLNNGGNFAEELPIQFLRTNAAGRAVFEHLSFKDYKLEVAKRGYQHYREEPVSITERGDGRMEVSLSRGAALAGTVVDAWGQAAEGVVVTARARRGEFRLEGLTDGLLGPAAPVVTDAAGQFRFEGMFADAEYDLRANPDPGLSAFARERPAEGITISLPETAFASGRVIDANGKPAVNAQVSFLQDVGNERRRVRPRSVRTNDDGAFLAELTPGLYEWSARHARGEVYSTNAMDLRGEVLLGDLQLMPGGRAELRFFDAAGERTTQVSFYSLRRVDGGQEVEPASLIRDRRPSNGRETNPMRFDGLAPGTYAMRFGSSAGLAPVARFDVRADQTTEVEVQLGAAATVVLEFARADGSPAGGRFRLDRVGPMPPEWTHLRDDHRIRAREGRDTTVSGIVPGSYILREDRRGGAELGEFSFGPGEHRHRVVIPN
ncbi:MAG: hypothetical protein CMJ94_12745 [Planctomycetes bacterium]|nr:hypothetical protein [Planctomycetota bacterium]